MYQKREKPKETFLPCLSELRVAQEASALQAQVKELQAALTASEEAQAASELKVAQEASALQAQVKELQATLTASEEAQAAAVAQRDELQRELEAAQQATFQANTQRLARERELRCALNSAERLAAVEQKTEENPKVAVPIEAPKARKTTRSESFARASKRLKRTASFARGGAT